MRRAELATFWAVIALPEAWVGRFCAWLRRSFGADAMGGISISLHVLRDFNGALVSTLRSCVQAPLRSMIPALGAPTDLTRVVDGI